MLEGRGIDFDPVVHVECEGAHIGCWYLSQLIPKVLLVLLEEIQVHRTEEQ